MAPTRQTRYNRGRHHDDRGVGEQWRGRGAGGGRAGHAGLDHGRGRRRTADQPEVCRRSVSVRQGGVAVGIVWPAARRLHDACQRVAAVCVAGTGGGGRAEPVGVIGLRRRQSVRTARCASLAAGWRDVTGGDVTASQATDARQLSCIKQAIRSDSDLLQAPMWDSQAVPAVAVTYANAYTQSSVDR